MKYENSPRTRFNKDHPFEKLGDVNCENCGKHFNTLRGLNGHLGNCSKYVGGNVIGVGVKQFHCQICQAGFVRAEYLEKHNKIFHQGERKHKTVAKKKVYGLKPKQCPVCGITVKGLSWHMKRHGPPEFECEICQREFHRLDNLQAHMRTHTKERPYVCPICQRGFTQVGDMYKHTQNKHHVVLPRKSDSWNRKLGIVVTKQESNEEKSDDISIDPEEEGEIAVEKIVIQPGDPNFVFNENMELLFTD